MLAVQPKARRRGIGTMLLTALVRQFAVRGIFSLTLEVRTTNIDALKFYQARGFDVKKRIEKFYTDDTDAYQMCKIS